MSWKEFDLFNPTEEHKILRETITQWVAHKVEPQALKFDREEKFNLDLFRQLGGMGLLGITVAEEFGGSGLDPLAVVIAHEEISFSDPGFCLAYLAHSMLCVNNLAAYGNQEQKQKYLPKLCSGEWIGAMAMSEANYGTDVFNMETKAEKKDGYYLINGTKMWITNGCIDEKGTPGDIIWLYAKTGEKKTDISTFIVEKKMPGFRVGQKIKDKTGMRASNTAELVFENCQVPVKNLVDAGSTTTHMMQNLEIERLALAAMALGIAKRCIEVMSRYANERISFGQPIAKYGQIQKFIAESYSQFQAARSYVYNTARLLNINGPNRMDSDGVKLVATPMAKTVADNAIQVLGGYGYVGEYVVERLWRDSKLLEIGGGTLEAHQKNITNDLCKKLQ